MGKKIPVRTGCQNCSRCTGSIGGNAARKTVRGTGVALGAVVTVGLSLLFIRRCRACDHPMGSHHHH
ncbi:MULTISPECIES: hypothetical protein [Streptomycetaceae]|uniref:hypothetical protein n=2 Tax=Kitasatosporales TaxID=85011 RepID=UPI0007AF7266|nr:hypothetical protein [Streptomyces sp. MJM8645]WSK02903.1 hypothetical protein OG556_03135 [Kitasatospora sp. NBC_01300]